MPEVIKQSFICQLILRFAALCSRLWKESGLCALFNLLGRVVPRWLHGSAIFNFLRRDGFLLRAWPESVTARALGRLFFLPTAAVRRVSRSCVQVLGSSVICRFIVWLGKHTSFLTGLFLLVLLCTPHGYWNNVYSFAAAVILALLFVLASARGELQLELVRMGPWFCLFFLTVFIALFTSDDTSLSVRFFLFHLAAFLFTLLIVSSIQKPEQLLNLLTLVALGLLVCGIYGCWQAYTGVEVVASQQDVLLNQGMPGRIYSFFDNPNNFAEILVMLLPLILALLFAAKNWFARILSLAALIVGVISLAATYSRSGWIGIAVALIVFLAMVNWKAIPFVLILGVLLLPLLPQTVFNRILTIGNSSDTSTTYRFYIYNSTFDLLKDYWFKGTGLGSDTMVQAFQNYPLMPDGNHPVHSHDNYLQMWAELGIFGGVFHIGALMAQWKQGILAHHRNGSADRRIKLILAGAVGAFSGILVIGIVEYTWYYPRNQIIFWVLFGIIAACVKLLREPSRLADPEKASV